ncbi:MAG: glycerol-3-phosphate acyltransferase [Candidatus Humimicrobiaceae bacterium]
MSPELLRNTVFVVISYLFGSIPFCFLIAKFKKKDLTKIGDQNPGGWNLAFSVSKFWGGVGATLDILKGFLPFFLILKFTGSEVTAIIAGCAAIAGHDYSPFLKFSGGKGIASLLGFLLAMNPFSIIAFGVGIVSVLFIAKNMIWGVVCGIIFACSFLVIINSPVYLLFGIFLLIIMIPKYINHSLPIWENFQFRKEEKIKDLFTPKTR